MHGQVVSNYIFTLKELNVCISNENRFLNHVRIDVSHYTFIFGLKNIVNVNLKSIQLHILHN